MIEFHNSDADGALPVMLVFRWPRGLRSEADRNKIKAALLDGYVDCRDFCDGTECDHLPETLARIVEMSAELNRLLPAKLAKLGLPDTRANREKVVDVFLMMTKPAEEAAQS